MPLIVPKMDKDSFIIALNMGSISHYGKYLKSSSGMPQLLDQAALCEGQL